MKYIITLNGNQYEVEVEEGKATANYIGKQSEQIVQQSVQPSAPVQEVVQPQNVSTGSGNPIKAPMPGTILKVNVQSGSKVKSGDILFILEAMKMENEIVAPSDGTITSVSVSVGDSVKTDAILGSIE